MKTVYATSFRISILCINLFVETLKLIDFCYFGIFIFLTFLIILLSNYKNIHNLFIYVRFIILFPFFIHNIISFLIKLVK